MVASATHSMTVPVSPIAGVSLVSLTSDRTFPRHDHDQFGIGVIVDGGHRSWSAIGPVEAVAGDVIMVNPGELHDGAPLGARPRTWRMLYLDPAIIADVLMDTAERSAEVARPAVTDPRLAAHIMRLFDRLTAANPDRLGCEEALIGCLMQVMRDHAVRPTRSTTAQPDIGQARRRLDEAAEIPVSLSELAALSGLSRFQFLRAFTRQVGLTPFAYLRQRRVGLARRHLAAGLAPAEAAIAAGFSDQAHLTRAFARQFGVTPGVYRAAVRH